MTKEAPGVKDSKKGAAVQIHPKREKILFETDIIFIPGGFRASLPEPTIVSP